ncbi:MAG: response regulator [Anaerolineales bacterium]|nr:response regulator [Anaerolineales bacterium]
MKGTILVVDDELYIRRIIRLVLEQAGYVVLQASTSEEGLRILKEARPDALTVDLIMPGHKESEFGGLALLEGKQLDPKIRDIPSLVLTAAGVRADEAVERAKLLGASETLRKPFSQRQLVEAVNGLLGA